VRKNYEVAIIGTGPSGAFAAYNLAKKGISTVIIDKETLPRYKICGGGLVYRGRKMLDFDIDEILEGEFGQVDIFVKDKDVHFTPIRDFPVISMVMRDTFDELLVKKAQEFGAELLQNSEVKSIENGILKFANSDEEIEAKFIIIADGALSPVSKLAGFEDDRLLIPAIEYEIEVPEEDFKRLSKSVRFDIDAAPFGYGWCFPKNNHLSVGVGVLKTKAKVKLKDYCESYMKDLGINTIISETSHGFVIPVTPRAELVKEGKSEEEIAKSKKYNLITDKTNSQFQSNITREVFCELIVKLYESLTKDFEDISDNPFNDTTNIKVLKAYNLGITNGISSTEFGPNRYITREEAATLLSRAIYQAKQKSYLYNENKGESIGFWDLSDISNWAILGVNEMAKEGYIEGTDSGHFYPKYYITIEESLALVVRVYESLSLEYKITITGVIHGGGLIEGYDKTNSLEAVQKSISEGGRILEIDFNFTRDGELACIHKWMNYYAPDYIDDYEPLSLYKFKKAKIFNKFTPLDLDDLMNIMEENEGTYLVTDIKDDNIEALKLISSKYPQMIDRIIPQAYSKAEVPIIKELGYKNIILTFYNMPYTEVMQTSALVDFAKENNLFAFTFSYELANERFINELKKSNILLLTHTISTLEEQEIYRGLGVNGFYTDSVVMN